MFMAHRWAVAALTAAAVAVGVTASAATAPVPTLALGPGQVGNDVSWPQCPVPEGGFGNPPPRDGARFVVIGLTKGAGFTRNPCLDDQVASAALRGLPAQGYLVPTYPSADQLSQYGAQGPWKATTTAGRLLNVGYAEAADALAAAAGAGFTPPAVWVDVERSRPGTQWPEGDTAAAAANRLVVLGVLRRLDEAGVRAGLYSASDAWAGLTGGWRVPGTPLWVTAGRRDRAAAEALCTKGAGWGGGPVHLAQWFDDSYDDDVTCPPFALRPARPRPPSSPSDTGNDIDANWASDLVARQASDGTLWLYPQDAASGAWRRRVKLATGWRTYDIVLTPGDVDQDGVPDLLARRGDDLWLFPVRASGALGSRVKVGSGWRRYDAIVGAGDLTGDDVPDLLARDRAGGLWLVPRTAPLYGKPGWGKPVRFSTGWRGYGLLTGAGDLTGDGHADLVARAADGTLHLFAGTGRSWQPLAKPVTILKGWRAVDALVGPGDVDRDGLPDLLLREKSTGTLWRLSRSESGSWQRPVRISTGWRGFDALS
ncbi:MAG TPA: VCBS repeat-containing protein [Kineosporiaceae bacterium]|nr:VCBS repeat-containing protein [Kineosporiaceae bacterium]